MMQVVGPIKQTQKQKKYCKKLGIEDINKVEITWSTYSICPHCNKVIYHEEKDIIPGDYCEGTCELHKRSLEWRLYPGEPEINSNGGWV